MALGRCLWDFIGAFLIILQSLQRHATGPGKKKQQLSMEPISTIILVYDILYVKLSGIHLASLRRPCEDPEPFRQVQAMLAEYRPDVVRLTAKDMMLRLLRYAQCVQQIPAELDR